ncbi:MULTISPECIES: hypothetical protein [Streptomyces]|uniref:Peptidase inhibitor family I36 n=1 Tax=Streptomyces avidinii TaxID=1895 RepID=A0ABS4L0S7_STRAV|nr:hypothetical protein [Streptomyces avidinii]MBP2034734.1 hypothetical protein [Streptomyces avidinii]GGY88492.1 hypothetical protein GCM10010343_12050 [Streptomyces avidinii]
MKKRLGQIVMTATAVAAFGLITAGPASAASSSCSSSGGTMCTSASIASNSGHQVCFGGKHNALASWGRAELWDGDTGVMVGSIATNGYRWQQACTGGLYGQHYYLKGTGGFFYGEVWN